MPHSRVDLDCRSARMRQRRVHVWLASAPSGLSIVRLFGLETLSRNYNKSCYVWTLESIERYSYKIVRGCYYALFSVFCGDKIHERDGGYCLWHVVV